MQAWPKLSFTVSNHCWALFHHCYHHHHHRHDRWRGLNVILQLQLKGGNQLFKATISAPVSTYVSSESNCGHTLAPSSIRLMAENNEISKTDRNLFILIFYILIYYVCNNTSNTLITLLLSEKQHGMLLQTNYQYQNQSHALFRVTSSHCCIVLSIPNLFSILYFYHIISLKSLDQCLEKYFCSLFI